ncbi:MAG: putative nucleotidyltransferase with HDIG domain [Sulfurimonas sp.]|jgi:putative nucleotidyltransferase with HDIG domain|uniref:bifunctional diguanylate cyclase/phosphohydrolase n=1 Tax=Sulfurimonas sp. TaxID=2022749 RepID=UPI0039E5D972
MTLESFVSILENRDTYTGGHSQRVANYSRMIAEDMNFSSAECKLIYRAGILHDIGKVTTPDAILLKPDKLSAFEYNIIKKHVTQSYNILLKIPMYKDVAEIIIYHHEHYDGNGYPNGLKNIEIPILAHIMIVADAFDAMTTNRIYKASKDIGDAIEELKNLSGKQFHPKVIKSVLRILSSVAIEKTINQLPKTELEKERFAYFYRDQLTNAYNTDYLNFILNRNVFDKEYKSIDTLYVHNFNQYNQKYSWEEGDILLNKICNYLCECFASSLIFRVHGDDFIVLNKSSSEVELTKSSYLKELEEKYTISSTTHHVDLSTNEIPNLKVLEAIIL